MRTLKRIYLFKGFERFWHWSQACLIIFMAITGFEIHGVYQLFGFEKVVVLHTTSAWALVGLWVFAIFWHITTGEWKQYIPTLDKLVAMARYYSVGIFTHVEHPFRVTPHSKLNPLQRLSYLLFKVVMAPLIWITGLLYFFYNDWQDWGLDGLGLHLVAQSHTAGAYLLLTFLVVHLCLITTGHTVFSHIKAMITGWVEIEVYDEEESVERQ